MTAPDPAPPRDASGLFVALLRPGFYLKRWVFAGAMGLAMALWGVHRIKDEFDKYHLRLNLQLMLIIVGIALLLFGIYKFLSTLLKYSGYTQSAALSNLLGRKLLEQGPRIVALGGGTGLSTILAGLRQKTSNITACVTVADEGGSSGRLREEMGILAPGDIRSCLVALSGAPVLMSDLFNYRFQEGAGLKGHNFGNLLIAALTAVTGSFERAVEESSRVLSIHGKVYPCTPDNVRLVAELTDGRIIRGEAAVGRAPAPIRRLKLEPEDCRVTQGVIEDIARADLIVVGPGSLYTSVLPNLLPIPVQEAIEKSGAPAVYICNIMTQLGETVAYSAADHLRVIYEHTRPGLFDWVIVNTRAPSADAMGRYSEEGAEPVRVDPDALKRLNVRILSGDFMLESNVVRHDAGKIVDALLRLCNWSRA